MCCNMCAALINIKTCAVVYKMIFKGHLGGGGGLTGTLSGNFNIMCCPFFSCIVLLNLLVSALRHAGSNHLLFSDWA